MDPLKLRKTFLQQLQSMETLGFFSQNPFNLLHLGFCLPDMQASEHFLLVKLLFEESQFFVCGRVLFPCVEVVGKKALVNFLFLGLDNFLDDVISLPASKCLFQVSMVPFLIMRKTKKPYFLLRKARYFEHIETLFQLSLLSFLNHIVNGFLCVYVVLNLRMQLVILALHLLKI